MADNNPGNFANRPTEEVKAIASKGGQASGEARRSGGTESSSDSTSGSGTASNNPGNFANRPKEEVREIASKGGKASGGGNSD